MLNILVVENANAAADESPIEGLGGLPVFASE
jgi:hypothetical protein